MENQFIKDEFEKHNKKFEKYLDEINSETNLDLVWSDSFPDFYPFQSEMNQSKPAKIYKKQPKETEGKIVNKYSNGKLIYSAKYPKENFGTVIYLYAEGIKQRLLYVSEKEEFTLKQLDYVVHIEDRISKRYFFMKSGIRETFISDSYFYNRDNVLETISRESYMNSEDNLLPKRTFRFEFDEMDITIYSKQLKLNGDFKENKIYTTKSRNTNTQQAVRKLNRKIFVY